MMLLSWEVQQNGRTDVLVMDPYTKPGLRVQNDPLKTLMNLLCDVVEMMSCPPRSTQIRLVRQTMDLRRKPRSAASTVVGITTTCVAYCIGHQNNSDNIDEEDAYTRMWELAKNIAAKVLDLSVHLTFRGTPTPKVQSHPPARSTQG